MRPFTQAEPSAVEAKGAAQHLAFAPLAFHGAKALRDLGVLDALDQAGKIGLATETIASTCTLSTYAATVLLECGLANGLVLLNDDHWSLAKVGWFILHDPMTRANMDFSADVCYRGAEDLGASLKEGRPVGLEHHSPRATVYEALAELPEQFRQSWFAFDHFYSDQAFPVVLPRMFRAPIQRLLDVGGNTGRFALKALAFDDQVHVTLLDHPGQLSQAQVAVDTAGFGNRFTPIPMDLLDHSIAFPEQQDVVWMSQFLDCFGENDIIELLKRSAASLAGEGRVWVLETFWDRQRFDAAAFSLIHTSLYFTTIANGTSRMYSTESFVPLIKEAGLEVETHIDDIGLGHTLLILKRAG